MHTLRKKQHTGRRPLAALLAAATLLLGACGQAAPEPSPEPTPEPTPIAAPEPTPCEHRWHGGVCVRCGAVCEHERHDAESGLCLVCASPCNHSYEHGVCTGCGREPLIYLETLPSRYLRPAKRQGSCELGEHIFEKKRCRFAVYTPPGYSEDVKYNVLIILTGDSGDYRCCIDTEQKANTLRFRMADVYDHMVAEHLCEPFIVVGIDNLRSWKAPDAARYLCEMLLPYLAEEYSTWAEDSSPEALMAARSHFALGGASRGSMRAYEIGMCYCLEYFSNFLCMSCISSGASIARALHKQEEKGLGIRCYVASWGTKEPRDMRINQYRGFHAIVDGTSLLEYGENAYGLQIENGHNWLHWSAAIFDGLQYLF